MFKKLLVGSASFLGLSSLAFCAPVAVDLTDATTSLTNAGTAMVGIGVLVLGFVLVLRFLRK